jgi:phosphatidylglycerophosphatase A
MKSAEILNKPKTLTDFLSLFLGTCFFSSFIPVTMLQFMPEGRLRHYLSEHKKTGAGFIGSVAGLVTYFVLPISLANSIWLLILGFALSIWAAGRAETLFGVKDDTRIIIDEWIGMWVAAWGLAPHMGFGIILAFVLFRFFDVVKGPWGKALQKLRGGWGVVMDDVVAGIIANVCMRLVMMLS